MIRQAAVTAALIAVAAPLPKPTPMPALPDKGAKSAPHPRLMPLRPEQPTPAQRVMPGLF